MMKQHNEDWPVDAKVDYVLTQLATRYADAWLHKWDGVDARLMRADWTGEIGHFHIRMLRYGLAQLPDKPPNAGQFKRLCYGAPAPSVKLLPPAQPSPDRVKQLLAAAYARMNVTPPWQRQEAAGEYVIKDVEQRKKRAAEQVAKYEKENDSV